MAPLNYAKDGVYLGISFQSSKQIDDVGLEPVGGYWIFSVSWIRESKTDSSPIL